MDPLDELVDDLVEARAREVRDDVRPRDDCALVKRRSEGCLKHGGGHGGALGVGVELAKGELHADVPNVWVDRRAQTAGARME